MNIHFLIIVFLLAGAWPAQAGHKAFFVHAMNTENHAKAESVKNNLKRFGNVQIDQQGDHFIVRIGPIKDGKKAVSVRNLVKNTHPDAFIRISASSPVKVMAAAPAPVSEPKSTVSVAATPAAPPVALAALPVAPAAPSKNRYDQPQLAGAWPAQAGHKAFFVHAMNTENHAKAESVKNNLKRFGNVQIDQQGDHFIVRIGPIKDGKKAVSVRNLVKNTHPDAFIRISASSPVKVMAAAPAPVSEPKSTVPVAVAPAAPPVALAALPFAPAALSDKQQPHTPETASKTPQPPGTTSSPDVLLKEALDHYQARRYENALQQLSLFLSLYPRDSNAPSAMFAVAGIQLEMKRPLSALRIYSQILERYAGTPEAIESIVALADMSMLSPGMKPSIAITGSQWYLDPVRAYDMVLSNNPPADLTERVLLQRIAALRFKGRYREAYDAGNQFLERYPRTKYQFPLMTALRSDVERLMDERIAAGDDIAVIGILSNARRKGLIKKNDTDILIKAAGSYSRLGMTDEARTLLSVARPLAAGRTPQVDAALEELARVGTTPAGPSAATDRWSLYQAGRQQIRSSNLPDAEKTLAQMRGTDQDAFWSKLADFTLKDGAWTLKYKDYLKK